MMKKVKMVLSILLLLFLAFQLFGLIRAYYLINQGYEFTSEEISSVDAYTLYFLWCLLTIPIVLWARKWGRKHFWYWFGTFFFFVTPIIMLLIKGKSKTITSSNDFSYLHFQTIVNYLAINLIFFYFYTSATIMGYPRHVGFAGGILIIILGYLISNRPSLASKKNNKIKVKNDL